MKTLNTILDQVGGTPVLHLKQFLPESSAELYVKLEGFNPGGSVKDRAAINMLERAEDAGKLAPGGTVVESSSGNLGVALAMACAVKKYRCIIVTDPRTTEYNRTMLKALGAEVCVADVLNPIDGTYQENRMDVARELAASVPGAYMPWQYGNPWNPGAHVNATAKELFDDFDGGPDAIVASVSTAGQVTGIGTGLKRLGATTEIVGVDVMGSVVFGGEKQPFSMTGMGLGFVPENLDERMVDTAYLVHTDPCFSAVRIIAKEYGILLGGSSGAAVFAAMHVAKELGAGKSVVAIAADRGEKYLDEIYSDEWMMKRDHPIDDDRKKLIAAAEALTVFRRPSKEVQLEPLCDVA